MYYNLSAIILKRENLRDDDLFIVVYSLEKGKVVLQAKGAKKILSKLAGHLEPVCLSNLNITIGKHIDHLIGAQIAKSYSNIKSNLQAIAYANYFIELINKLTQEDHPDRNIFRLLEKSLDYLETGIYPERASASEGSHDQQNNMGPFANAQGKLPFLIIARISFGYKLLHLLGFSPAQKPDIKLREDIDYIINNPVDKIIQNSNINNNLSELNKILDQELEDNIENEIKTKEFLKSLQTNKGGIRVRST